MSFSVWVSLVLGFGGHYLLLFWISIPGSPAQACKINWAYLKAKVSLGNGKSHNPSPFNVVSELGFFEEKVTLAFPLRHLGLFGVSIRHIFRLTLLRMRFFSFLKYLYT